MAGTEPEKRKLTFNSPDDIVAEARSLYENGYVSNGNWSLGQLKPGEFSETQAHAPSGDQRQRNDLSFRRRHETGSVPGFYVR